jgi:dinuclear metal center YbgI/SA1388 family protein
MENIQAVVAALEALAPPMLQETYDNAGLITGHADWALSGILCTLDVTEDVVSEAVAARCNCIVAHHPIIFGGLNKLSGNGYVQRALVAAIKHDVAIYAIHTNLDNVLGGVNGFMADALGLLASTRQPLSPREGGLLKMTTYVPSEAVEAVRHALFSAGAGRLGAYTECSFEVDGIGGFRPGLSAQPYIGVAGAPRQTVIERRIEVIFEPWNQAKVVASLKAAHPYQTPAYDVVALQNGHPQLGSGLLGQLAQPMPAPEFLKHLCSVFGTPMVRFTRRTAATNIMQVAVCGGAGSFLIKAALAAGADALVTADLKYHEFFEASPGMLLADVGHFESEQHTINGLAIHLKSIFPTFAVLKSSVVTNPVQYFLNPNRL